MGVFQDVTSLEDIEKFINQHRLAFLYITTPNCSVCHGLQPQIEKMLEQYPNIHARHVDASVVEEVAGRFSVFTSPVLLLFVHGKEYIREARIVHTSLLNEKIARIYENMVD